MQKLKLIALFFLIKTSTSYNPWKYKDLKSPRTDYNFCKVLPNERSFICDPESYLTLQLKSRVSQYLERIRRGTPSICDDGGFVLGVLIISRLRFTQFDCKWTESRQSCVARHLLYRWGMSPCHNDGLIIVEADAESPQTSIWFGENVQRSLSTACITKLQRETSLMTIDNLEETVMRASQYGTGKGRCVSQIEDSDSMTGMHTRTEMFVGLVVGTACIVVLLVFLVPSWRSRIGRARGDSARRNSNIVRPLRLSVDRPDTEPPPNYSDVIFATEKPVVDGLQPPSYSEVLASPLYGAHDNQAPPASTRLST